MTPNLELLQNALDQTQGLGKCTASEWRSYLSGALSRLDVDALARDVRAFLERPEDRTLLNRENLASALAVQDFR